MKTYVIVDSSQVFEYEGFKNSVLRALKHFGIFFEIVDLSQTSVSSEILKDAHLLIFAQENIGKNIDSTEWQAILNSVSEGMGLLSLDGNLSLYPTTVLKSLNIIPGKDTKITSLKLKEGSTFSSIVEEEVILETPVPSLPNVAKEDWSVFLTNEEGIPSASFRFFGAGRVILFSISSLIWQNEYIGFAGPLDRVFRDSIVWVAKKPYIMKIMPPFVTGRIDDISFGGSRVLKYKETLSGLKWLDILNDYGFIPNAGLFIDDILDEDAKRFKEKEELGLVEFSPHGFVDFAYMDNEDLCPIYLKHNGEEFTNEELKRNFERVDTKFKKWGINYSQTVNVHYAEIGINSLPFLKERGHKYLMTSIRVGKSYFDPDARSWKLSPYANRDYCFGYIPEDNHFFNVLSTSKGKNYLVPHTDMLYGCTTLHKESPYTNVEKSIDKAFNRIKQGIDRGFFGCIATHEQRIAQVNPQDWELIIKGISDKLRSIPHIMASYDHISRYAENRLFSNISQASYNESNRELTITLKGKSCMEQKVYLFTQNGEDIVEKSVDIPEFEGSLELNIKSS
ncbi:hypothetical protein M0P98_02045 [bacterium]|nr:hypothetical protein [bacterium]